MNLPDALRQFVDDQISLENYMSEDEVVIAGLRLLKMQNPADLQALLDVGLRQLENGECIHLGDAEARREYFEDLFSGIKG